MAKFYLAVFIMVSFVNFAGNFCIRLEQSIRHPQQRQNASDENTG